jgi:hypothetical protein
MASSQLPKTLEFWLSDKGLLILNSFGRAGMTVKEVCEKISISQKIFKAWMETHHSIRNAFNLEERNYIDIVEGKLLKAVTNEIETYNEKSVVERIVYDSEGKQVGKVVTKKTVEKPIKIESELMKFYLTNRAADKWAYSPEPIKKRNVSKLEEIMQEWVSESNKESDEE